MLAPEPAVARSHPQWRSALVIGGAPTALAAAIWLIPASVHIVDWPEGGPVRLALLAPASRLLWLTLLAWTVSAVIFGWAARARGSASLDRLARIASPALLLWLWAVPYLPWLSDRLPLLLVLSGSLRWVIAAIAVVWMCDVAIGHPDSSRRGRVATLPGLPVLRRGVLTVSLVLYAGLGLYWVSTIGIDGDEPHYLIIAESLLHDGDLQIENNHQRGDYRAFYVNDLPPHYVARGRGGVIYSHHAPGLAVLLLPVYAVMGHYGAVALIAVLGALTALAIFDLAAALAGVGAAILTWVAVCLSVPFVPYSWSIFPEMPAALITAWAALWLFKPDAQSAATWALRGLVIGCLPWLHIKFSILAASLSLALAFRLRAHWRVAASLLAPVGVSAGLWFSSYWVMYGTFDPSVTFGYQPALSNIPHGLLGLLFDQKFGLLPYSPIYLLAPAGAWFLLRDPATRAPAAALFLAVGVFVLSTSRIHIFWGGLSAPARFLVPTIPALAPAIAVALARLHGAAAVALSRLWLATGLAIAAIGVARPAAALLFSDAHGYSALLQRIRGGSPLPYVVPMFTEPDWQTEVPGLLLWIVAAAAGALAAIVVARIATRPTVARAAIVSTLTFLFVAALFTRAPEPAARRAAAERGSLDALWLYDENRDQALQYSSLQPINADRLLHLAALPLDVVALEDGTRVTTAVDLPAGIYDVEVWSTSRYPRPGEIVVSAQRAVFAHVTGAVANPTQARFELPVSTRRVQVRVSDAASASIERIRLVPRSVVPARDRERWPVRTVENTASGGGYIVYTGPEVYPEGGTFWTHGTAETQVYIVPRNGSKLTLTISTGPVAGNVTVTVAGRREVIAVAAGASRTVVFDLAGRPRFVPVAIQSGSTFRPSDAGSADTRDLGCQVRVEVK